MDGWLKVSCSSTSILGCLSCVQAEQGAHDLFVEMRAKYWQGAFSEALILMWILFIVMGKMRRNVEFWTSLN